MRNQPRNSAVRRVLRCQNMVLNEVDGHSSKTGRIKGRTCEVPGPCRIAFNGACHRRESRGGRGCSGSETQHLPNMKSGTSITRSSRGEALKRRGTPLAPSHPRSGERARKGERKRGECRWRRRSEENRKYWIHATPTHNAACAIFSRFPFHAVAYRAPIARTTGRREKYWDPT